MICIELGPHPASESDTTASPVSDLKVYNGQGPEEQYLVGPAIATYSSCDANTPGFELWIHAVILGFVGWQIFSLCGSLRIETGGCLGLGIAPIPTDSTSPSAVTSTTSETSVVTSPSEAGNT